MVHTYNTWRDSIQWAANDVAVVKLIHEYVSTLSGLVGELPQECQDALIGKDVDVQAAAVALLRAELAFRGSAESGKLLHEIAYTFAAASVRLSQLRTQLEPTPPSG
jgi:hypothetical protein